MLRIGIAASLIAFPAAAQDMSISAASYNHSRQAWEIVVPVSEPGRFWIDCAIYDDDGNAIATGMSGAVRPATTVVVDAPPVGAAARCVRNER